MHTSTRNLGDNKRSDKTRGILTLPLTIKSKGSSKIIGAAIVPTKALPNANFIPYLRDPYPIIKKQHTAASIVIGFIGPGGSKFPVRGEDTGIGEISGVNKVIIERLQTIIINTPAAVPGLPGFNPLTNLHLPRYMNRIVIDRSVMANNVALGCG
ncbi:MAG: hypothetical protein H3Z53_10670 [archaeon]|nr:hypothetical protein [archaeon]